MMLKVVDGERKMGYWIGACLWLLLPMMASCQTVENRDAEASVPPEAFTAENWYQVEKPNPKQIVRIHGRAPETLDIFIMARYVATNAADDRCWRPARHFGSELLWSRRRLPIRRDGDRYEAELIVDKYLPGPCGWRYEASSAGVMRAGHPDDLTRYGGWVIDSSRYDVDDSLPRCKPMRNGPDCSEERLWRSSNHDETPVEVPCHVGEIESEIAYFICQRSYGIYKKRHLLRPDTREIEINFYDLDNDPVTIKEWFEEELE
ncbi:MAG: hypothetical protein LBL59_03510 [Xanthomonadaceae bacterium]|jgi:hypothetical protein|nr:hypothetical protein [Xanthomonadaceae bacterium]